MCLVMKVSLLQVLYIHADALSSNALAINDFSDLLSQSRHSNALSGRDLFSQYWINTSRTQAYGCDALESAFIRQFNQDTISLSIMMSAQLLNRSRCWEYIWCSLKRICTMFSLFRLLVSPLVGLLQLCQHLLIMQLFRELEASGNPEQKLHELLWTAVVVTTSFAVLYGEVIDLILKLQTEANSATAHQASLLHWPWRQSIFSCECNLSSKLSHEPQRQ